MLHKSRFILHAEIETLPVYVHIETFAPASKPITKNEIRVLQQLQVVANNYMTTEARQFCECAGSAPVLHVYGSGMTPMLVTCKQFLDTGNKGEHRLGRALAEWLLHASYFIKPGTYEEYECRTLFEAPVLMHSKKAFYSYAAATRMIPCVARLARKGYQP